MITSDTLSGKAGQAPIVAEGGESAMRKFVNAAYLGLAAACILGILLPASPLPSAAGPAPSPSWDSYGPPLANVVFRGGLIAGSRSQPGVVSNTPLFVKFNGSSSLPQRYVSGTLRFLQELARSAGSPSNPLAPITTLYDRDGRPLADSVSAEAPNYLQLQAPTRGDACQPDAQRNVYPDGSGFTACVVRTYLESTVMAKLRRSNFSFGVDRIYSIFLPPGVEVCEGPNNVNQGGSCNWGTGRRSFAAYHDAICQGDSTSCTAGSAAVLTVEPYPTGNHLGSAVDADVEATVLSLIHELAEVITDPIPQQPGWVADNANGTYGGEVGDVCETVAVPFHQDLDGFRWNVQLGSKRYFSQGLFDARGPTCRP